MLRVRSGLLERIGLYSAWQSRGRNRHVRTALSNSPSVSSTGAGCFPRSRGKPQKVGALLAPVSITLFAQGDLWLYKERLSILPSTPVRTGRPLRQEEGGGDYAFDPCSHREARRGEVSQGSRSLRPLFAQGGQPAGCSQTLTMPSTPVRTGRPKASLGPWLSVTFDPCSHRET